MNNKIKLGKEEIISLLQELGDNLLESGIYAQMYIYGGAVLCTEYSLRETTFDIDCIYTDDNVRKQAKIIAKKRNMHQDWLSDAVAQIVFEDMYRQDLFVRDLNFAYKNYSMILENSIISNII